MAEKENNTAQVFQRASRSQLTNMGSQRANMLSEPAVSRRVDSRNLSGAFSCHQERCHPTSQEPIPASV